MSMLSSYRMEHLRVRRGLRGETSGGTVAGAVIDGEVAVADDVADVRGTGRPLGELQTREGIPAEVGARRDSRTSVDRAENLANQVARIKRLAAEHDRNLAGTNLDRAREVVRLGLLMITCLEANARLKKKDLARQLGKDRSWVTRFTRAARLADDPQHISHDVAAVILQRAHGNVRRAARPGRVCTLQSLTARIVRAYQDATRYEIPTGELQASVKEKLTAAGIAGVASMTQPVSAAASQVWGRAEPGASALSAMCD